MCVYADEEDEEILGQETNRVNSVGQRRQHEKNLGRNGDSNGGSYGNSNECQNGSIDGSRGSRDDSWSSRRDNRKDSGSSYRYGRLLWSLLLFIILSMTIEREVTGMSTLPREEQTVNRLNYGVIFNFVGRTKPTTSLIRHTFKVRLPMRKNSEDREFVNKLNILSHERNPCIQQDGNGDKEIHDYFIIILVQENILRHYHY